MQKLPNQTQITTLSLTNMKRFLLILSLFLATGFHSFAQEGDDDDNTETVRDKMTEYIQQKLNLNDAETKQFKPVFVKYFKEWRSTIQTNKGDKVLMQQKLGDLQLRYRDQFKNIIGLERSNKVFTHQRDFIQEVRRLRLQRQQNGQAPRRRN